MMESTGNYHAPVAWLLHDAGLYVRTLEVGQVQESDFFHHTIHDDLDSIVRDLSLIHIS